VVLVVSSAENPVEKKAGIKAGIGWRNYFIYTRKINDL
jgi:hypothetical protein